MVVAGRSAARGQHFFNFFFATFLHVAKRKVASPSGIFEQRKRTHESLHFPSKVVLFFRFLLLVFSPLTTYHAFLLDVSRQNQHFFAGEGTGEEERERGGGGGQQL